MRLQGQVALISGGSRGLGAAIAERFGEEGARVVIGDIRDEEARETAQRLGAQGIEIWSTHLDVTDPASWDEAIAFTRSTCGPLDILVNNAGVGALASIEDTSLELWRSTMAVNLDGVFLGTKAGITEMRSRGGAIVNVSSIRAFCADPASAAYDASKGGMLSLTRSAAVHCAQNGLGIRINALHPGYVMTDLVEDAAATLDNAEEVLEQIRAAHPIGRTGTPREIADAALFLASKESSFMVGSSLVVDGGYMAV